MLYCVYTGDRSVLRTNQCIQLHTDTNFIPTCISGYICIWSSTRSYIRLWTLNICVQVCIYEYIRVCNILQKHAWLSDSNRESNAYREAALTTSPQALIPTGVFYDLCLKRGSSLSLRWHFAFWLMSDVLRWAGSTPAPAMMRGFAKRGFKFKPPGPALPGCHVILIWVSLPGRLYLSPSHYAPSGSARSLRPYTCFRKCAWAIKANVHEP